MYYAEQMSKLFGGRDPPGTLQRSPYHLAGFMYGGYRYIPEKRGEWQNRRRPPKHRLSKPRPYHIANICATFVGSVQRFNLTIYVTISQFKYLIS